MQSLSSLSARSLKADFAVTASNRGFLQYLFVRLARLDAKFASLNEKNTQRERLITLLKTRLDERKDHLETVGAKRDQ